MSPNQEAIADGAYIKALEEFTFYRGETTQAAIKPNTGGVPANPLTVISCQSGWTVCAFETLLNADFFQGAGFVVGEGSAFLGLGSSEDSAVRIRTRTRGRNLQVDEGKSADELLAERATNYKVSITVVPVEKVNLENQFSGGATVTRVMVTTTTVLLFYVIPYVAFELLP